MSWDESGTIAAKEELNRTHLRCAVVQLIFRCCYIPISIVLVHHDLLIGRVS